MLKLLFLTCFVGYVVSQAPNPFGLAIPEGCDLASLQQCLQPLMEQSAIMTRQADMSIASSDIGTVCRLMTALKSCVMPKLARCGREIMMVANASVKALDYMCVDARAETEKYYRCLSSNNNTLAQMNECVSHFMVSQMEVAAPFRSASPPKNIDIMGLKTKLCSNLNRYEQCLENKADYLCGEKAYITKVFNLFNEGLRFINCQNLGSPVPESGTGLPPTKNHFKHPHFGSKDEMHSLPQMPPILMEMQCVGTHFQKCLAPLMSTSMSTPNVDQICSMYEEIAWGCLFRNLPSECETKARVAVHHFNKMAKYLCGEAKQDLEASMSCFVRQMPHIGMRCLSPMMSASARGDSFLENGRINHEMKEYLCRAESQMQDCISSQIKMSCGERADHVLTGLIPMYSDMTDDLVGLDCRTDHDLYADSSYIVKCFGPRGRHILKIVLPIVGVLLLAIIIGVTVALCRRRRRNRNNARKAGDKADLVKNDLLQQNLRYAITQTPKEKNDESLKI